MAVKTVYTNKQVSISGYSAYQNNSYTQANRLAFGRGSSNDEYRLLLGFPSLGIPAGSIINSATLTVPKTTGAIGSQAGFTADACRLTDHFTTGTTWNTQPGYTDTGKGSADTGTGHSGNVIFDVKSIVEAWLGGSTFAGILLRKPATGGIFIKCMQTGGAYLTINYTEAPSTFTLSASSVAAGDAFQVNISRASSAFTHKVEFKFGGHTITHTGVGTTDTIQTTLAHLSAIPNAVSGAATVTVTTYNGAVQIGSPASRTLTITAPATVKPTLSSLGLARVDGDVPSAWGIYVQGKSKATLTIIGAAGAYGSTIAGRNISGAGQNGTTSPWTTGFLAAGTHTFSATARDSRGRTSDAKSAGPITVHPYAAPAVSGTAARCTSDGTPDSGGTYMRVVPTFSVSSCDGKNTVSAQIQYREAGAPTWITAVASAVSGTLYVIGGGGIDIAKSYQVRVVVTDAFTMAVHTATISPAAKIINVRPQGKGIAFGRMAEVDGVVDTAWPMRVQGYNVWHDGNQAYELGAWTPSLSGSTTAGSPTYTERNGRYQVFKDLVLLSFVVAISAKGGLAGQVRIGGMPFVSGADIPAWAAGQYITGVGVVYVGLTALSARTLPGESYLRVIRHRTNTAGGMYDGYLMDTELSMDDTPRLAGTLWYRR